MATASGCGAFAPSAEFPALNGLAARAKTPCALLRSNSFREHETIARLKTCWVAGSPAASACALFAPQPAHAHFASPSRSIHEWVPTPMVRHTPRITAALDGLTPTPRLTGGTRRPPRNAVHGRVAARIKH